MCWNLARVIFWVHQYWEWLGSNIVVPIIDQHDQGPQGPVTCYEPQ